MAAHDPQYIVFIRVPFPRGNFVDPPFVEWDAAKDKQLWKILSNTSKNNNIDWNKLALKFDVPLTFLLQQIACLYERQMQQVQAQIRKVRDTKGLSLLPVAADNKSDSSGEVIRAGQVAVGITQEPSISTKGGPSTGPRISSALAHRRETTVSTITLNNVKRTIAPSVSRINSSHSTTQSSNLNSSSPQPPSSILNQGSVSPKLQGRSSSEAKTQFRSSHFNMQSSSESNSIDSSSDSELSTLKSALRRPLRFTPKPGQPKYAQEEGDDLVFMPVATENLAQQPDLPNSLVSQIKGKGREGNDGTPSMGSSFSDLDDTSITQSALEEALASNMQVGGMASRMSSISQALRSKYLQ